ncbi:hypothetical protein D9M71_496190 [compost metagenome]
MWLLAQIDGLLARRGPGRHALPAAPRLEDVGHALHQLRALADQLVAATRARVVDRARNGEHLAALLGSQAGGDQRTAGRAGLDHQHAEGQPADDAVAPGEIAGVRRRRQRQLGDQRAALGNDALSQPAVALGIDALETGAEHRHGGAAGRQGALVGGAVDAQRQPAGDHEAAAGQAAGEGRGGIQSRPAGLTAADHGQLRTLEQLGIAGDPQQRRRVAQLGEQRGVVRIVEAQQVLSGLLQPGQGSGGLVAHCGAAPRQGGSLRQTEGLPGGSRRAEGGTGRAEHLEQAAKAPRTDLRQAMQAQAGFQFGRRRGGGMGHGDRP